MGIVITDIEMIINIANRGSRGGLGERGGRGKRREKQGGGREDRRFQSLAYPIFTVRWVAIHALAVPAVFFIGSITAMQFLQKQKNMKRDPFNGEPFRDNPNGRAVELNRTSAFWGFLLVYVLGILFVSYLYN